jgi:hypothetical protein
MAKKKHEAPEQDLSTEDLVERAEREDSVDPKFRSGAKARDEAAADATGEKIVREQELHDPLVLMRAPIGTGSVGVTLESGETLSVKADGRGCVEVPERFVEKLLSHGFVGEPRNR